jgi:HK97 family phage major capsid protein
VIMGDFTELYLGVRSELRVEVLREKYADALQYGFLAWLRMDVAVAHAASFAKLIGILP